jgi:glycosyltransferase involved in cell wall biosynthesis
VIVAFDARDAFRAMPHGSGIYVARLLAALREIWPADLSLVVVERGWPGPEVIFEQVGLPLRLARELRGDAGVLHGPDSFLPLRRGCPGVLTVHDLAFLAMPGDMPAQTERKYRWLVPRAARSAQRVICPSAFTAADVERRLGVPRERIRVIPEAAALPPGELDPPAGPYLLAAGDLRAKKNLGVLVRAVRRLHAGGWPGRLILAGLDLGVGAGLQALAGEAPVELAGFVTDAELDALIRGAAAVVVPGVYEGFGLAALDAMARGVPTVLARAGALPETGGTGAAYFAPFDDAELATVLERLLSDPEASSALGAAGASWAARFSWAQTGEATLDVYRELL